MQVHVSLAKINLSATHILNPLTLLTEEDCGFSWDNCCQKAFQMLKNRAPVLSTSKQTLYLGRGCQQSRHERIIKSFSIILSKAKWNYHATTSPELLAVVTLIEYLYKSLHERKFLLRTNHTTLKQLFNVDIQTGRETLPQCGCRLLCVLAF